MIRLTFLSAGLAATLACGSAFAAAPSASAKAAAQAAPLTVDKSIKRLPFGKDHKAVLKWIERRITKTRRVSATVAKAQVKRIEEGLVAFTAKADLSKWTKSVIADEFQVGNDESMLSYTSGKQTHFFFFHRGKLFKYAKPAAAPPTQLGFVDRVNSLSKSLGAPTGTVAPDGGDRVVEARWIKSKLETRIVDKRASHNSDVLVVEDSKLAASVLASRRGQVPAEKTYEVDPALKEFLE